MRKSLITALFILSIFSTIEASETREVCYYGLYNQDTNELIIESDSMEYLESIEHEYQETMTIEVSQCESNEIEE